MENSKVKALFFSNYFEQTVFSHPDFSETIPLDGIDLYSESGYLLLRAVDQLTDDELINCAYLHWKDSTGKPVDTEWVKRIIGTISQRSDISDYLRAIGILLPFTYIDENGKPQTLQPDEIIANGWAKIKENGN